MPKLGMEAVRRRQLIEATVDTIHEVGFAAATLQAIARRAGVSPGLVAHYFGDKNGLLEATLRALYDDLTRDLIARLAAAETPRQRLEAVIEANLAPGQFDPRIATVWLAFWAQALHVPELARVQRIYQRRMSDNLLHAAKRLLPAREARDLAEGLAGLIDGLWLHATLGGGRPGSAAARRLLRDYLESRLPKERAHA
jgi:transcriptional repressor BetI